MKVTNASPAEDVRETDNRVLRCLCAADKGLFGGVSQAFVVRRTGYCIATVISAVDRLVSNGHVEEYVNDRAEKRSRNIKITPSGYEHLGEDVPFWKVR